MAHFSQLKTEITSICVLGRTVLKILTVTLFIFPFSFNGGFSPVPISQWLQENSAKMYDFSGSEAVFCMYICQDHRRFSVWFLRITGGFRYDFWGSLTAFRLIFQTLLLLIGQKKVDSCLQIFSEIFSMLLQLSLFCWELAANWV